MSNERVMKSWDAAMDAYDQYPRDTFDFVCHLRRLRDGRVLLIGLPKGNSPIADELMPRMGDAGACVGISFPEVTDRTEYGIGKSHIDLIEEGLHDSICECGARGSGCETQAGFCTRCGHPADEQDSGE